MSLRPFQPQAQFFAPALLSRPTFDPASRFHLFGKHIYPLLVQARPQLEGCYCAQNGRPGLEPVVMMGITLLQYLEGATDREAVELVAQHQG